jgi:hypothetical protein
MALPISAVVGFENLIRHEASAAPITVMAIDKLLQRPAPEVLRLNVIGAQICKILEMRIFTRTGNPSLVDE